MDGAAFVDHVQTFLRRMAACDFQREKATDDERAQLAVAARPIADPAAQDYAAWRRAVLWIGGLLLCLSAMIDLIGYQSFEDGLVEGAKAENPYASRDQIVAQFGSNNVEILDYIPAMSVLSKIVAAILAVLGGVFWVDVLRSRRFALFAWLLLLGMPLFFAIVPWASMLDFSHQQGAQEDAIKSAIGVVLGLTFFVMLAPKVVAIFPGIIRASMTLKTLLPETAATGWAAVLFAPFFALFLIVAVSTINQMQGNLLLLGGITCLILGVAVYLKRARDIVRPHHPEEVGTLLAGIRRRVLAFNAIGIALVVIFLVTLEALPWDTAIGILLDGFGGVLLIMVVFSDLLLGLLRVEFQQGKEFYGTELAASLESRLEGLTDAGLTRLRLTKGFGDSAPKADD